MAHPPDEAGTPGTRGEAAAIALNELLRAALLTAVRLAGAVLHVAMRLRLRLHATRQRRLAARYGVAAETPILAWGAEVKASVEAFAAGRPTTRFAYTSGSTAEPKKIAFPPARLRALERRAFSVAARLIHQRRDVARMGLLILRGLHEDDSLTSLLLAGAGRRPAWPGCLVTPGSYLARAELAPLVAEHGLTATRLWLLALCDPGIVYSTNPSTLAVFLAEVHEKWTEATRMIRAHLSRGAPPATAAVLRRAAARLGSPGWRQRFARLAAAPQPLPLHAAAPGWRVYCCWDGGYVGPFLDAIRRYLPEPTPSLVPMYSMSTETLETLTHFEGDRTRFLPIAPEVLYEFLPEDAPDDPALLLPASAVEVGRSYTMVVSDPYGLRRYQTEDLFTCAGKVGDVPDLRFVRRRGLAYSFTGEKLTDTHVTAAFARLRAEIPELRAAAVQLTCVPSLPGPTSLPRYRLVLACPGPRPIVDLAAVAASFDRALAEENRELAAKLASGRLAPSDACLLGYDQLAAALDPHTRAGADVATRPWDTQFKLLPLYRRRWEEVAPAAGGAPPEP